jgi:hypothetical protein
MRVRSLWLRLWMRRGQWHPPVLLAATVISALWILWLRFNQNPDVRGAGMDPFSKGSALAQYFVPLAEHAANRLAAGELPLWNPYTCSGIPLLATFQVAPFYPGTWLSVWLPAAEAMSLRMFLECALSGWFCALLFYSWGKGVAPSAMGAIVFIFSCLLGQTLWPPLVSTLLWLPWILLCVDKLAGRWSWAWFCGLSFGTTLHLLGGFPQLFVYSCYIIVPYASLRLMESARAPKQLVTRSLGMAAAVVLGFGLASVQVLPTLELISHSMRLQELSPAEIHYLNRASPHTALDVLRAAFDPSPAFISLTRGSEGGFLGISVPIFMALGVATGWRSRRCWLWLLLGGAALLLADGYQGWASELYARYARIPVVGSFRTSERMRLVTYFCAIALAVSGFAAICRPESIDRRRMLQAVALVASVIVAGVMFRLGTGALSWRVVATLVPVVTLLQWPTRVWIRRAAPLCLLALVVFDLAGATGEFGSLRRIPSYYSKEAEARFERAFRLKPGSLAALREEAGLRRIELAGFKLWPPVTPPDGSYRTSCYEPLVPSQLWMLDDIRLRGKKTGGRHLINVRHRLFPLFYDVTSVTRVLYKEGPRRARIFVNEDALPRAYLVNRFEVVSNVEALEKILDPEGARFRELVYLDRDPGLSGAGSPWPELREARIIEYEPERVVIEVNSPGPALLVLTDTHYPGWRATMAGEAQEILRANGLFRAVRVGGGQQRVEFEYRPASLRAGAALSLASLTLLAGTGLWHLRSRSQGG